MPCLRVSTHGQSVQSHNDRTVTVEQKKKRFLMSENIVQTRLKEDLRLTNGEFLAVQKSEFHLVRDVIMIMAESVSQHMCCLPNPSVLNLTQHTGQHP